MKNKITIEVKGEVNVGSTAIMRLISNTLNNVGVDTINCDPDVAYESTTQDNESSIRQAMKQIEIISRNTCVKLVKKQLNRCPGPDEFDFGKFIGEHTGEPVKPAGFHTGSLDMLLGDCKIPIRVLVVSSDRAYKVLIGSCSNKITNVDLILLEITPHEYRLVKSRFSKKDIMVCKYDMDAALYEINNSTSHKVILL